MATMCDTYVSYGWKIIVHIKRDGHSDTKIRYYIGVDKQAAMAHAMATCESDHSTVIQIAVEEIPRCYVAIPALMELHGVSPTDLE